MLRVKSFLLLNTTTLILQAVEMGYWKKVSLWMFGKSHEMLSTLLLFSLSLCSMPTTGQLASQEVILFIKIFWNQFGGWKKKNRCNAKIWIALHPQCFIQTSSLGKQAKKKYPQKRQKDNPPNYLLECLGIFNRSKAFLNNVFPSVSFKELNKSFFFFFSLLWICFVPIFPAVSIISNLWSEA